MYSETDTASDGERFSNSSDDYESSKPPAIPNEILRNKTVKISAIQDTKESSNNKPISYSSALKKNTTPDLIETNVNTISVSNDKKPETQKKKKKRRKKKNSGNIVQSPTKHENNECGADVKSTSKSIAKGNLLAYFTI